MVDNIARQCDSLNEVIGAGGLAILDVIGFRLGRYEAELAANNDNVVGRGSAVLRENGQLQLVWRFLIVARKHTRGPSVLGAMSR